MLLGGEKKLDIRTINVPRLNIRVSQVFQNNLVYFIQNGRYYDYDWSSGEEGEDSSPSLRKYRYSLGNFGRQLSFDTLAIQGPDNQEITTLLDLNPYLHTGYRGFYLVEIAGTAEFDEKTAAKRIQADFDNYKKRVQRDREDHIKQANDKLISDLVMIPVVQRNGVQARSKDLKFVIHKSAMDGRDVFIEWEMILRFKRYPKSSLYGSSRLTLNAEGKIVDQRVYFDLCGDIFDNILKKVRAIKGITRTETFVAVE